MRNVFYFSKKVRLFSQNDVLFLFYFLINPAGTTEGVRGSWDGRGVKGLGGLTVVGGDGRRESRGRGGGSRMG